MQDYRRFGDTSDIIKAVLDVDALAIPQGQKIKHFFKDGNPEQVAENIHAFLSKNVKYSADKPAAQVIKTPAALVGTGLGDCKSFSVFARSVFSALGIESGYKFVGYNGKDFSHVYNVFKSGGRWVTFDGILSDWRLEAPHSSDKIFIMPTHVYTMNGPSVGNPALDAGSNPTPPQIADTLNYQYAITSGDYLPYLVAYNDFWNNWMNPLIARVLNDKRVNRDNKRLWAKNVAYWLKGTWENSMQAQSLAIGKSNAMYAATRRARGMWSITDQQATVAQHPKFIEYVKLYTDYIDNFSTMLIQIGGGSRAEVQKALDAFIFLANFNQKNYSWLQRVPNGSAAIGEPVTISLIITGIIAVAGSVKAVSEMMAEKKSELEAQGIDVDALLSRAGTYLNKPKPGTGTPGTGTPGTGTPGEGTPQEPGPGDAKKNNQLLAFGALLALALFAFK